MKSGIEKNLTNLMDTFEAAGIRLTESQKAEIKRYVRGLEPTDSARDAKFRSIFETIQHNMDVRSKLQSKVQEAKFAEREHRYQTLIENMKREFEANRQLLIKKERQNAKNTLNEAIRAERQKMAKAVDKYLDRYLESVIPQQTLVDYKRLHELEAIVENMKDTIAFSDTDVARRVSNIRRGYETKLQKAQEVSAAKTRALNEATDKINEEKAKQYVVRRTKDLPALEAKLIREKFTGYKSIQQVRENFSRVLNEVEDELATGGNTEINAKLNNLDSKVNGVDSKINDLDSKIDQLVDTSMGGGSEEPATDDAASGDAGDDMDGVFEPETSDGEGDMGTEAPAGGDGAAPDFGAMTDDEINAHEFGTDDQAAAPEGEQDGEEVAPEQPEQQAQPAAQPQQAPAEQPAPAPQQEQPVTEDFTIDSALMDRFVSECIHITP